MFPLLVQFLFSVTNLFWLQSRTPVIVLRYAQAPGPSPKVGSVPWPCYYIM